MIIPDVRIKFPENWLRIDSPHPFWRIPVTCPTRLDQMQTEIADLKRKLADLERQVEGEKQSLRMHEKVSDRLETLSKALRSGSAQLSYWRTNYDRCGSHVEAEVTSADGYRLTIKMPSGP